MCCHGNNVADVITNLDHGSITISMKYHMSWEKVILLYHLSITQCTMERNPSDL